MSNVQRCGRADDISTELAQCEGWLFWSQALGIESAGGGYIVEYIFFIMFSVSLRYFAGIAIVILIERRYFSPLVRLYSYGSMLHFHDKAAFPRSKLCWGVLSLDDFSRIGRWW